MNQAIISGHAAADASPVGDKGYAVRIATNEKGKDGVDRAEFHNCIAFGYLSDRAAQVRKGDAVTVIGRLETRKVARADNSTAYFTSVVANQLYHATKVAQAPAPAEDEHTSLGF